MRRQARAFPKRLGKLWKDVKWDNARKEAYWLLALNGMPTPQRMHMDIPCACGEGGPRPGRRHAYWECAVARAVVQALQAALPVGAAHLECRHVWLCEAPPGCDERVWRVVCLAAVDAMQTGWATMARRRLDRRDGGAGSSSRRPGDGGDGDDGDVDDRSGEAGAWRPPSATQPAAGDAADPAQPAPAGGGGANGDVECGAAAARVLLIRRLREFCTLGVAPWAPGLPTAHPFIAWDAAVGKPVARL